MKFLINLPLLSVALLASSAAAQTTTDPKQSKPFTLSVLSENATYNGGYLNACHEGAAIEGLCFGRTKPTAPTFAFNYTDSSAPNGDLVYNFTYTSSNGIQGQWVPASLTYNLASNLAIPLFQPTRGNGLWTFDVDNELALVSSVDDTKAPGQQASASKPYKRWYVCNTYAGYSYVTLAWAMGDTKPQNPTCVKVTIKRVFAS